MVLEMSTKLMRLVSSCLCLVARKHPLIEYPSGLMHQASLLEICRDLNQIRLRVDLLMHTLVSPREPRERSAYFPPEQTPVECVSARQVLRPVPRPNQGANPCPPVPATSRTAESVEATGPGVLGVSSDTLHLSLLPAARKFGRTRFGGSVPFPWCFSACHSPPPPSPYPFPPPPLPFKPRRAA